MNDSPANTPRLQQLLGPIRFVSPSKRLASYTSLLLVLMVPGCNLPPLGSGEPKTVSAAKLAQAPSKPATKPTHTKRKVKRKTLNEWLGVTSRPDFEPTSPVTIPSDTKIAVSFEPSPTVVAPFPELINSRDPFLQTQLNLLTGTNHIQRAIREHRFAAALVDITDPYEPHMAAVNGDDMMYAASLPKIAILLGAFEQSAQQKLTMDDRAVAALTQMIRSSSNSAATEMFYSVGPEELATILESPKYRLYDRNRNGGLWVGKPYAQKSTWKRDPLHNISHGATAIQVARFYYLLETGRLVSPEASAQMKMILSEPAIAHKFVKGMKSHAPKSKIYRKSGTWRTYHADSGIIEHDGRKFIAVVMANDERGGRWLSELIVGFDKLIASNGSRYGAEAVLQKPQPDRLD